MYKLYRIKWVLALIEDLLQGKHSQTLNFQAKSNQSRKGRFEIWWHFVNCAVNVSWLQFSLMESMFLGYLHNHNWATKRKWRQTNGKSTTAFIYLQKLTNLSNDHDHCVGTASALQIGHQFLSRSHWFMHVSWNPCWHSTNLPISSPLTYSSCHTLMQNEHKMSF